MLIANWGAFSFGMVIATLGIAPLYAQERATFDSDKRTTVGDWAVECLTGNEATVGGCQLYQRVLTQDPNVAAMIVALAWSPPGETLLAQVSLPLGSDLTKPPLLSVDGVIVGSFFWSRCIVTGCLIEASLSASQIGALIEGKSASFTIAQPNAGDISIPVSLTGFAEGLEKITPQEEVAESPANGVE
ncbi:invasion associated locus B family protein [Sulfitobacter sp. R18_2]|uniref:invasion associated locus B family protein n=1 Tax=Sulfitobacter sp. R18_2 TaxID=2821105 RepID=UPI001AD9FCA6|nr:invasion associated locus B family protein [Sulfitobacter sp. R18_2]MBO9440143.1 invasion associated locus B family protein [Sulfitobacter sp. R18_2]